MTNRDAAKGNWTCSYGHQHGQWMACAEEARHGINQIDPTDTSGCQTCGESDPHYCDCTDEQNGGIEP